MRLMGFAFHQLCPRYSGTLTPTATTAIRLWEAFTFIFNVFKRSGKMADSVDLKLQNQSDLSQHLFCPDLSVIYLK